MRGNKTRDSELDKKGTAHLEMVTINSDGWKYKKLEDKEADSSDDSTTTDEHKKMLN